MRDRSAQGLTTGREGTQCCEHRNHSIDMAHLGDVRDLARDHLDAIDDRAHANAERAARAVVRHVGQVRGRVKRDCLVARVIAGHVALAAVDAHFLVDQGNFLVEK